MLAYVAFRAFRAMCGSKMSLQIGLERERFATSWLSTLVYLITWHGEWTTAGVRAWRADETVAISV